MRFSDSWKTFFCLARRPQHTSISQVFFSLSLGRQLQRPADRRTNTQMRLIDLICVYDQQVESNKSLVSSLFIISIRYVLFLNHFDVWIGADRIQLTFVNCQTCGRVWFDAVRKRKLARRWCGVGYDMPSLWGARLNGLYTYQLWVSNLFYCVCCCWSGSSNPARANDMR